MPILPYHRRFRRIRRPEFEQRRALAYSSVDSIMVTQPANTCAVYDRTAARVYQRRDTGPDGVSAGAARVRQATRFRAGRSYHGGIPERGTSAVKRCVVLLLLALLVAGFASGCKAKRHAVAADPLRQAYDSEADWNDAQRVIPLSYDQAQGKRIFYLQCVWCHADYTPAGPSNRSNLKPMPQLMNDGTGLDREGDDYLDRLIDIAGCVVADNAMI